MTDRLCRQKAKWRYKPLATVASAHKVLKIESSNLSARSGGVYPGFLLADAYALIPDLKVFESDPVADAKELSLLADWCGFYTPRVAVDGIDSLWLDISGCAHLFGGEDRLVNSIESRMQRVGFEARVGLADSPGTAWAAARFLQGKRRLIAPGATHFAMMDLPSAALRLPTDIIHGLDYLGLSKISDFLGCPRGPLAVRFGSVVGERIDQALGHSKDFISWRKTVPCLREQISFSEPLCHENDIAAASRRLIDQLCSKLAIDQCGVRDVDLILYTVNGKTCRFYVRTNTPERNPDHLMKLLRENLRGFVAEFGIEAAVLVASQAEPLRAMQRSMEGRFENFYQPSVVDSTELAESVNRLIDSLSNRIGEHNVSRFVSRESHLPERAVYLCSALKVPLNIKEDEIGKHSLQRPIRLFSHPERIKTITLGPNKPPTLFYWRREEHQVVHAEGPERISPEWWRYKKRSIATRDYYHVENERGKRFWLYCEKNCLSKTSPTWFLHGIFA